MLRTPSACSKSLALVLALVGGVSLAGPALADGAKVYADACAACHMPNGEGIEGAFPKLKGSALVVGPQDALAGVLMVGRGGMPGFAGDLSDDQISEVLTYIRSAWGNAAPAVGKDAVAAARAHNRPEERESLNAH